MNESSDLRDFAKLVRELREAEEDFVTAFDRGLDVVYEKKAQRKVKKLWRKVDRRVNSILDAPSDPLGCYFWEREARRNLKQPEAP